MNASLHCPLILSLVLLLPIQFIDTNDGNGAEAQVGILSPSPGHTAVTPLLRDSTTLLTVVGALGVAPHNGTEIAVWDPPATPAFGITCPLPSSSGGTKWQLMADTDGDMDFTDVPLGAKNVTYSLAVAGATISFEFGDGTSGNPFVTVLLGPGATVDPPPAPMRYAWQNMSRSGPLTFGDDNTSKLGQYDFASCGRERPGLVSSFLGTATFDIVGGMIEWEKRRQNPSTSHPLQGGATFRLTPNPFTGTGFLDVTDGGVDDMDLDAGQIKLNNTRGGTFIIREISAPQGCNVDVDARSVTVSLADRNQVVGIQGVDDDSGNVNERDFHNICPTPPTKIIIKKDTIPNDPQDFTFTHNIPPTPFTPFILDDDSNPLRSNMKIFDNPPPGTYTVTETTVKDIPLQSIKCIDPDGGSVRSGNSAIIDLDAGDQITCTFVNAEELPPCEAGGILSEPQPEDAISMTTIRNGNIVKTIHAEKQIFDCEITQDNIPVIIDVTIIAEIYQDMNTQSVLSKQVEVISCIKDPATIRILECKLSIPSTDRIPVTNCQESEMQHPQEMDTVRKGSTAKTIEAQKEVFTCTMNTPNDITDDKKVDLVLFTEIYQNLNTLESPDLTMLSMKCVIKIDTVQVESCQFRQVNS